jgi:NADPH2:quinone reductase
MTQTMKAVRCNKYSALGDDNKPLQKPGRLRDVLCLEEVPAPECEDGDVLLSVNYAGIQYPDALQAQGLYQLMPPLPYIPGMDATGTVLEVGAGVAHVAAGDRVIAQMQIGALAEIAKVPAAHVWKAPDGIHLSKCANIGRNFFAAYHSLKVIGEVGSGDLVLVDGASGGVGMASIELAKAMGAQVIAGVSTPEKMEAPKSVGADRVLCYGRDRDSYTAFKNEVKRVSAELGHPKGVDLVIDVVQGELFEPGCISTVRSLGKIAMVGFTGGQKPIRPGMLLIKQAQAIGSLWGPWAAEHPEAHQNNVREILGYMASGQVKPRVDRIFAFEDFIEAFELFENNQARGNTVVCVKEESAHTAR